MVDDGSNSTNMNIEDILQKATAGIEDQYFQLPVAGQEDPIYRERVYCYELYHQLRSQWPEHSPYSLSGEVDKGGHRLIRGNGLDNVKPDFLVHVPGTMDHNLLVIEVKPVNARDEGIKKDLETLTAFHDYGHYKRALYLIYGDSNTDFHKFRKSVLFFAKKNRKNTINLDAVELWHHEAPGTSAKPIDW